MQRGTARTITTQKARHTSRSQGGARSGGGAGKQRRKGDSPRKPRAKQGELAFRSWGGARKGAGRKPKGERAMAPHDARSIHQQSFPVLITTRLHPGLPSLRRAPEAARVLATLACANARVRGMDSRPKHDARSRSAAPRFQVVHHSIQSNHLHLIVEAPDRSALTSGMRWLLARIARALNRFWGRRGSVFADRFHERELRSPRQVRNALVYVLQNLRKHGISLPGPDPLSSGPEFDGWEPRSANASGGARHPAPNGTGTAAWDGFLAQLRAARIEPPSPKTWLLGIGWRRHGLIDPCETPRAS